MSHIVSVRETFAGRGVEKVKVVVVSLPPERHVACPRLDGVAGQQDEGDWH